MPTIPAAALSAAHIGRTASVETADEPTTGTLADLDVTPDVVTVTVEAATGGRVMVDVHHNCPVALSPAAWSPMRAFACDVTAQHLGRAVDFGGLSRSHSGILTGVQVHDRDTVTVILDSGRWFEIDLDCVLTFT
ncbi:hypothetical protein AB0331_13850 [Dietzia maris]|uniref:hypothetical protein n=1 Tax=Dietzia maris TaxID=37915 RepID=UPI00344F77D9